MGVTPGDVGLAVGGVAMDFANTAFANRLQTRAAHQAQDFSAQQYATRYQTQVQDLKKAGLNPMLAYMQSPGSAPSGVMANQQKAQPIENILGSAQAMKVREEVYKTREETENLRVLWHKLDMEVERIGAEIKEIDSKAALNKASQSEIARRIELVAQQTKLTEIQARLAGQQYNINTPEEIASGTSSAVGAAHVSRVLKPIIDAINGALKSVK